MRNLFPQPIRNPRVLVLAMLILFLPFGLRPSFEVLGATVRLSQLAGLFLIGLLLPQIWRKKREWLRTPWVFLVLFLALSLLSSLFAAAHAKAFITISYYGFVFMLAYVVSKVFKLKDSQLYKGIIYATGAFVVVFCLFQFIGDSLGIAPSYTLLLAPYTKVIFGFPRIQGFSLEPLYLANYLLIPLSLSLIEYMITSKKSKLILVTVFLTAILLTVARGAYFAVGLILTLSLLALLYRKAYKRSLAVLLTVLLSIVLSSAMIIGSGYVVSRKIAKTIVPENSRTNLPSQEISVEGNAARLTDHVGSFSSDMSYQDRLKTIEDAIRIGAESPLLGVGPGNFGTYVVKNIPTRYRDTAQVVNNEPAEIFAETGIVGLIFITCFITWLFRSVIIRKPSIYSQDSNVWFYGTALMLVGFILQWQTFSTLYITHVWVIFGIFMSTAQKQTESR